MITIVSPCFNEQSTIAIFLKDLEATLSNIDEQFRVIIVDDCSQDASYEILSKLKFSAPNISFRVLRLKFNMGHQGAIHQGLLLAHKLKTDRVIIMDSDGEDNPAAIPLLLEKENFQIVVVRRGKRSESMMFKIGYFLHKIIFRFITNQNLNFGHFCMIDGNILERIKHTSFIHLPAYLLKQKATKSEVIFNRSKRIDGKSKVGYKGLLLHSFKSMIEFGEDLLMLFFKTFILIMVLFIGLFGNILYQKFIVHTAIPGWFSTLAISLIILGTLCLGFFIIGLLLLNLIHQQNNRSFLSSLNHNEKKND
jgi:glycosyltransferase involved in cell wall biosynthesis